MKSFGATLLVLLLAIGMLGQFAAPTRIVDAQEGTPETAPEECDDGTPVSEMDPVVTGIVWAEGAEPQTFDPAGEGEEFRYRQSILCLSPGASAPEGEYPYTYLAFVISGQLAIQVTEFGNSTTSPATAGQVIVYRDNVAEIILSGDEFTLDTGDAVFFANVTAIIRNPSDSQWTVLAASGVVRRQDPGCVNRCWIP
jgi:hypothetical protein